MKARIAKQRKTALLYGIPQDKEMALRDILEPMEIHMRTVSNESITMTLGALAGLPGYPAVRAADDEEIHYPACEALVFSGASRQDLDHVLAGMKEKNLVIQLKAVVTQQNSRWTFEKLLEEIQSEDRIMRVLVPLRRNLERVKDLDLSAIPVTHRRAVELAITHAKKVVSSHTADPEEIKSANEALIAAIQAAKNAEI